MTGTVGFLLAAPVFTELSVDVTGTVGFLLAEPVFTVASAVVSARAIVPADKNKILVPKKTEHAPQALIFLIEKRCFSLLYVYGNFSSISFPSLFYLSITKRQILHHCKDKQLKIV